MSFQLSIKKYLLLISLATLVSACSELGYNPLDPNYRSQTEIDALEQSSILINYKLSTLNQGVSLVEKKYHDEGSIVEVRRDWKGVVTDAPTASMVLLKTTGDAMPPPPGDPKDARGLWKEYNWRAVEYFDLFETNNDVGYVLWRKFLVGGRLCVIFQQGWGADSVQTSSHVLTGYYCNAPGVSLSDGQAETVVQSVSVWEEG